MHPQRRTRREWRGLNLKLSTATMIFLISGLGAKAQEGFDQRRKILLDWGVNYRTAVRTSWFRHHPKHAFWYAQACLAHGKKKEACELIEEAMKHFEFHDSPFQLWACMDLYMRWRQELPAALRQKIRQRMAGEPLFSLHKSERTENKVLMLAAANYLAYLAWPNEKFVERFTREDPYAIRFLKEKAREYVHFGEREHNSPTYYVHHYGAFRSVADFAEDGELRKRTWLAAEWLLAAAAPQWLNGHWAAPTRRTYVPFRAQNGYRAGTTLLWLYFGGRMPVEPPHEFSFAIQAAISNYRVPEIIQRIATKRQQPYLHRECHANSFNRGEMVFFSQTWMTPEYAVFSGAESQSYWPVWNDQYQRWGICWQRDRGNSIFFVVYPTGRRHKETGASQYEHVLQFRNHLLSITDVPPNKPGYGYFLGYIPENPKAMVERAKDGELFLDYGNVWIAAKLTSGYEWRDKERTRMVIHGRRLGLIATVTRAEGNGRFGDFVRVTTAGFHQAKWSEKPVPALDYTTPDGHRLQLSWGGKRLIDGQEVFFKKEQWPLLENPWMHQGFGSDRLILRMGTAQREYNFKTWTVQEKRSAQPSAKR